MVPSVYKKKQTRTLRPPQYLINDPKIDSLANTWSRWTQLRKMDWDYSGLINVDLDHRA